MKHGLWPLGRTKQVHPGQDGIVPVVDVHTKTVIYMRLVIKVYPLEWCYIDEVPQGGGNVTESTPDKELKENCYKMEGHLLVIPCESIVMNTAIITWEKQLWFGKNNTVLIKLVLKFKLINDNSLVTS